MDLHCSCLSPSCALPHSSPTSRTEPDRTGGLEMCIHVWLRFFLALKAPLESHWVGTPALPPVLVNLLLSAAQWGVPRVPTALYLGAHMCRAWPQPWEQPVVGPGPAQGQLCIPRASRSLLLCRARSGPPSLQILNKCQRWDSVLAWDHLCWVRCPGVLGPHIAHPGLCPLR